MALTLTLTRLFASAKAAEVQGLPPGPIDDYLAAYNDLQETTKRVQALVDPLQRVAFVLSQAGASAGLNDAWKTADIEEVNRPPNRRSALRWQISLSELPTATQLQEAIAEWHLKRDALAGKWDRLRTEARRVLKSPTTLD